MLVPRACPSTLCIKAVISIGVILGFTLAVTVLMQSYPDRRRRDTSDSCVCPSVTPKECPATPEELPATSKDCPVTLAEPLGTPDISITGDDYLRIRDGDPFLRPKDPQLLEFIRRQIVAPSRLKVKPYNDNYTDFSQIGQSIFIDRLLGEKTNGFHLEVGAADGETMSNSLYFELKRNWTGLLIEANPYYFESMLRRNRQAYSINACLSPNNQTAARLFRPEGFIGGLSDMMDTAHRKAVHKRDKTEDITVQCFPIYSIFLALGLTHIDYFSLDIEGPEADILRTIPWGAIRIDTFTVEFRRWNGEDFDIEGSKKKLAEIRKIFKKTDLYEEVTVLPPWTRESSRTREESEPRSLDVVFRRRDLDI